MAGLPIAPRWGNEPVVLLFILPVLAAAAFFGLRPALSAAVASTLAYNYFFTAPYRTLLIHSPGDVVTVIVLFAVALVTSHLAGSMREQARLAEAPAELDTASPVDLVAEAKKDGRLDGAFVEQAAQNGKRDVVIAALTQLANVSEQTVKKILNAGSAKPIVALVWHAHLSMRVAFKIQTGIMKLSSRDLLPARGGIGFPLTKEEMRWHLGYFDISA